MLWLVPVTDLSPIPVDGFTLGIKAGISSPRAYHGGQVSSLQQRVLQQEYTASSNAQQNQSGAEKV